MLMKKRGLMEEMMVRLFGSTSRQRILRLILRRPQQAFYQREIIYETGLSLLAVQREVKNFLRLEILKKRETKPKV